MSKPKRERVLADNEAKAIARMLRVSPQKLNLVAQLIRGRKASAALADLQFSRKRIAVDVKKCREPALATAENSQDVEGADLVAQMAAAERRSSTKSRSATLSIELRVGLSNPSALAVALRSMGKEVPASAAAPSGHSFMRVRASTRRERSRPSIST